MSKNKNEGVNKIGINWYPGHMAKTKRLIKEQLKYIDIVLEVIDSRIPKSSKIKDIEEIIKNKKRIIVMTKYDMCDKKETNKWVNFYQKKGYKVVTTNLLNDNTIVKKIINSCNDILKDFNQNRIEKGLTKRKIRSLVIGIPNVGKSTLINKLAGKKVVNIGNLPGITKNLNWIRINKDIELLDTPGILWPKFDEKTAFNLATMTAIKEEVLPINNVCMYILNFLSIYYNDFLKKRYDIDDYNNEEFAKYIEFIGKKRGCIVSGGMVDCEKVYMLILRDIRDGLIGNITFDRYS